MSVRKLVNKGRIRMKRILGHYTMQVYGISCLFFVFSNMVALPSFVGYKNYE